MAEKGRVLLKVTGIIMVISGVLSIILSCILAIVAASFIAMGGPSLVVLGIIILIVGSVFELIAGIVCTKNAVRPKKAVKSLVWCLLTIVFQLIGSLLIIVGENALGTEIGQTFPVGASVVVSLILGVAVPVIGIIGAIFNKKSTQSTATEDEGWDRLKSDGRNAPDAVDNLEDEGWDRLNSDGGNTSDAVDNLEDTDKETEKPDSEAVFDQDLIENSNKIEADNLRGKVSLEDDSEFGAVSEEVSEGSEAGAVSEEASEDSDSPSNNEETNETKEVSYDEAEVDTEEKRDNSGSAQDDPTDSEKEKEQDAGGNV